MKFSVCSFYFSHYPFRQYDRLKDFKHPLLAKYLITFELTTKIRK